MCECALSTANKCTKHAKIMRAYCPNLFPINCINKTQKKAEVKKERETQSEICATCLPENGERVRICTDLQVARHSMDAGGGALLGSRRVRGGFAGFAGTLLDGCWMLPKGKRTMFGER